MNMTPVFKGPMIFGGGSDGGDDDLVVMVMVVWWSGGDGHYGSGSIRSREVLDALRQTSKQENSIQCTKCYDKKALRRPSLLQL